MQQFKEKQPLTYYRSAIRMLLFTGILIFGFQNTAFAQTNNNGNNDKTLEVRSDWGFPPFEYISDNGKPTGFSVDIIKAILDNIGYKYNIQLDFWPNVIANLEAKKIDLVTGIIINPERTEKYFFSQPITKIEYGIVARKDDLNSMNSAADLKDKAIMINESDLKDKFIDSNISPHIFIYDQAEIGLRELSHGRHDAMVGSVELGRHYIESLGLGNLGVKELNLPQKEMAIASTDSALIAKIDIGLQNIKNNGSYNIIYNKWFVATKKVTRIPYYWLIPLLIILVLCVGFIYILKRRVKKAISNVEIEKNKLSLAISAGKVKVWAYHIKDRRFTNVEGFDLKKEGIKENLALENYIHPDDLAVCKAALESVRAGNEQGRLCVKARSNSAGTWEKIELESSIQRDENGNPQIVIGTLRDVTSDIEYKELLEYQKKKMEFAIRGGDLMLWEYDVTTHLFTSYNEIAYGLENGTRIHPEDYINIVHPSEQYKLRDFIHNLMDKGLNKSYTIDIRYKLSPNETNWRYATLTGTPLEFDKDGKAIKYSGLRKDTTAVIEANINAREYSDKLNYILISSKLLIFDYNLARREITISSGDNNIITLSAENYINRNHPDDRENLRRFNAELDNAEIDTYTAQRRILLPQHTENNECTYVTINGTAFRDEDGKITSYSGLRRNITPLIEIQNNLKKAKSEAEQADKLKSAFLANMSHEIRTPLNAIVGFSELLVDPEDIDERKEYMNIINANNELLLRLISDILDLSKIESGVMEFKIQEFDFAHLFSELGKSLMQRISNPNITLVVDQPHKQCVVSLDSNRVAQVITNFGTNAIKYTAEGTIHMKYESNWRGIRISVTDTGIGIPENKKNRIFQRFEKLDNFAQGTGLGLSICKAIVEACHGEIGFESKQGEGSTFWAFFPCKPKIQD